MTAHLSKRTADRLIVMQIGTQRQCTGLLRQRAGYLPTDSIGKRNLPAGRGKCTHTRRADTA